MDSRTYQDTNIEVLCKSLLPRGLTLVTGSTTSASDGGFPDIWKVWMGCDLELVSNYGRNLWAL